MAKTYPINVFKALLEVKLNNGHDTIPLKMRHVNARDKGLITIQSQVSLRIGGSYKMRLTNRGREALKLYRTPFVSIDQYDPNPLFG